MRSAHASPIDASALLAAARRDGLLLWVESDRLRWRGPWRAAAHHLAALAAHRAAIVALLSEENHPDAANDVAHQQPKVAPLFEVPERPEEIPEAWWRACIARAARGGARVHWELRPPVAIFEGDSDGAPPMICSTAAEAIELATEGEERAALRRGAEAEAL